MDANDKATLESVIAMQRWTDTLFSFKTTRSSTYQFTPGQFARLGLDDTHGMMWRAYSITSTPDDDFLEYYVVTVPDGAFSQRLQALQPGDRIWVEKQSHGFMTTDRFHDGDDLWMLATGTGLGPYVSILRDSAVWKQFQRIVVVHCVRHANEFAYQDVLRTLPHTLPFASLPAQLQLIQSVTGSNQDDKASERLHGRITTLLDTGQLERHAGLSLTLASSRIMLCGNPQMIDDTRKILQGRQFTPCRRTLTGQFITENYW